MNWILAIAVLKGILAIYYWWKYNKSKARISKYLQAKEEAEAKCRKFENRAINWREKYFNECLKD